MTGARAERPWLGCIADDYTGAVDVAAALRRGGASVELRFGPPDAAGARPDADAVVVALKTRTLERDEAVRVSLFARDWLVGAGSRQLYFKYCSTFDSTDRGNIGPVADALLDAAGADLTVVCPASPEHGRTVYQGHLFVHDVLLSDSPMRHHPLTPMTDARLVRLLGRQTPHEVALVPHSAVRDGPTAVAGALGELHRRGVRFAVTDALNDSDLESIATAAAELPVVTGAAGLGRALARRWPPRSADPAPAHGSLPRGPALILAGSWSARTREQVAHARPLFPSLRLDPGGFADADEMVRDASAWLADAAANRTAMIYSCPAPGQSAARPPAARALLVERAMGGIARSAVEAGRRRLVIAGGETSGAVVEALGLRSVTVEAEEDRGVPWVVGTTAPPVAVLLKSGNFGRPDLFERATG